MQLNLTSSLSYTCNLTAARKLKQYSPSTAMPTKSRNQSAACILSSEMWIETRKRVRYILTYKRLTYQIGGDFTSVKIWHDYPCFICRPNPLVQQSFIILNIFFAPSQSFEDKGGYFQWNTISDVIALGSKISLSSHHCLHFSDFVFSFVKKKQKHTVMRILFSSLFCFFSRCGTGTCGCGCRTSGRAGSASCPTSPGHTTSAAQGSTSTLTFK